MIRMVLDTNVIVSVRCFPPELFSYGISPR